MSNSTCLFNLSPWSVWWGSFSFEEFPQLTDAPVVAIRCLAVAPTSNANIDEAILQACSIHVAIA